MERIHHRDKPQEGTAKLAGKAGPPPWQIEKYLYKEESKDDGGSSHNDPRLEFALQSHGQHQDDFIPSDDDGDHGYGYPAFGIGVTPDLHASASFASELGTLAGTEEYDKDKNDRFWGEFGQELGRKKARDNWNYVSRRCRAKTDDQYLNSKARNRERWQRAVDGLIDKHFNT